MNLIGIDVDMARYGAVGVGIIPDSLATIRYLEAPRLKGAVGGLADDTDTA